MYFFNIRKRSLELPYEGRENKEGEGERIINYIALVKAVILKFALTMSNFGKR